MLCIHDTAGCSTGCPTHTVCCWMNGWMLGCMNQTCSIYPTRCSTGWPNWLDNGLVCKRHRVESPNSDGKALENYYYYYCTFNIELQLSHTLTCDNNSFPIESQRGRTFSGSCEVHSEAEQQNDDKHKNSRCSRKHCHQLLE